MADKDSIEQLKAFAKSHDFFIGIDSDGCAFDTMEIKHKECFIPNIINSYDLQAVSRFARETAEWVNLYSRFRGINRFPALVTTFDLLGERPECVERGYRSPPCEALREWIAGETRLGNPALSAAAEREGSAELAKALEWSRCVNETVARFVRGVPPFPHVRESLDFIAGRADVMVVSATPNEALIREWREHEIDALVGMICGQEMGTKTEHIACAATGRYEPDRMLMIGDAPGDLKAARANGACFFPIRPGDEAGSWEVFRQEAAGQFFAGSYRGEYEDKLVDAFLADLPEEPHWRRLS